MRTTFIRTIAPLAVGLALAAGPARAQTADEVTPEAGPWLVCVTSYTGPLAKELTEGLIQEIKAKHGLPAYSYCRSAEERRKEQDRINRIKQQQLDWLAQAGLPADTKLRGPKTYRIEDQYAVLVGGYKDDDAAAKAAQQVRKWPAPPEKFMHQAVQGAAGADGQVAPDSERLIPINPFKTAFPVRNPSLPAEKHAKDDGPDPRLKEYNAGEAYSLLKNRKPWTLAVKSYQGATTIKQEFGTQPAAPKVMGSSAGRVLQAGGMQAHELAEMLRKLKFEAYVLHTEYSSVVTIGGFDAPDDPRLLQLQRAVISEIANPNSSLGQLHTKAQVQFFAQPMPMPVPKF
jgi:hypothetical protein